MAAKKTTKKGGVERVGIIDTILATLRKTSEAKPISKKQLAARLVKKFPDRSPEGMMSTVQTQVPGRLRKRGFEIEKTEDGRYYLVSEPE